MAWTSSSPRRCRRRPGRLERIGPPEEVYARPASAFVADFVGLSNRLPGEVIDGGKVRVLGQLLPLVDVESVATGSTVTAFVRPEAVTITIDPDGEGRVVSTAFLGASSRATIALPGDVTAVAQVPSATVPSLTPDTAVQATLDPVPVAVTT